MKLTWVYDQKDIDWEALSNLYKIAPLGDKKADDLKKSFGNSMYTIFVFDSAHLVGAGRALADGVDCSYICDVAIIPKYQGKGIGKRIVMELMKMSEGHRKIILYANPGKEGFYQKLGFLRMNTAMAVFQDRAFAVEVGLVSLTS